MPAGKATHQPKQLTLPCGASSRPHGPAHTFRAQPDMTTTHPSQLHCTMQHTGNATAVQHTHHHLGPGQDIEHFHGENTQPHPPPRQPHTSTAASPCSDKCPEHRPHPASYHGSHLQHILFQLCAHHTCVTNAHNQSSDDYAACCLAQSCHTTKKPSDSVSNPHARTHV
jgi:hypothetical protein